MKCANVEFIIEVSLSNSLIGFRSTMQKCLKVAFETEGSIFDVNGMENVLFRKYSLLVGDCVSDIKCQKYPLHLN